MKVMAETVYIALCSCTSEGFDAYVEKVLKAVGKAIHIQRDSHYAVELFMDFTQMEKFYEEEEIRRIAMILPQPPEPREPPPMKFPPPKKEPRK